ncbi:MAG TPA: osmoprotectant NAGGN system M42 family peptidase [Egicoccus sp.]|nr:osmoprotectant NAGGN system M42 family peptidase [Egicoccus sp.]HSK23720.1 osmoprotectant NAGGN system M42 family peptidase [Egicoccus sp.]
MTDVKRLELDLPWMQEVLLELLRVPSPSGRTDVVMQHVGERLEEIGLPFEVTRRGVMVGSLDGGEGDLDRAVVIHTDTIGCMVQHLKDNGRLAIVPVGTHSARFSEGSRVTILTDDPEHTYTGTILPTKASGHAFGDDVDTHPIGWEHVEVRVDEHVSTAQDLADLGIQVGDFVAQVAFPVISRSGYVTSRHLDDKAGVAATLAAFKAVLDAGLELEVGAHLLITTAEEVGHGASSGLYQDVAELVSVDAAVVAPGQHSTETGVSIAMQDLHGPFDYHLSRKLHGLARAHGIEAHRDVFRFYRSDVASALEAGAETRAALVGFGVDATHGWERTHLDALRATGELLALYLQTPLTFAKWDAERAGRLKDFPSTAVQPVRREPEWDPESPDLLEDEGSPDDYRA